MKIIATPTTDFASYIARPDTIFIEREGETLEELYAHGYLPYSSSKNIHNVFYSARSARVVLAEFILSSENRRIAKKFDDQFKKEHITDFVPDTAFYTFCTDYFTQKHGVNTMPQERLQTIYTSGLPLCTTVYRSGEKIVAYTLEVVNDTMRHYWFSFYDLSLTQQSLGMWLMLDSIRDAKVHGIDHYYLGTVYGPKALYKTNFAPLEWWEGRKWSRDIVKLKDLSRAEA